MSNSELEKIVVEKARQIGVDFKGVKIAPHDPTKNAPIGQEIVGSEMFVQMQDRDIILEINDLTNIPKAMLEIMIEHEVCHCKDGQEGIYGKELASFAGPLAQVVAMEMYKTFIEYFVAKRQIREFGQSRFDQCQLFGLENFVASTKRVIHYALGIGEKEQAIQIIFSYFKEQIKCNLMSQDPRILPQPIPQIVGPLPQVFDAMANLNIPWMEKTKINYLLGIHILVNVNLIQSFSDGRLVLSSPNVFLASYNLRKEIEASRLIILASRSFELYLRACYQALIRREPWPTLDVFYKRPLRMVIGDYFRSFK